MAAEISAGDSGCNCICARPEFEIWTIVVQRAATIAEKGGGPEASHGVTEAECGMRKRSLSGSRVNNGALMCTATTARYSNGCIEIASWCGLEDGRGGEAC